MANQPKSLPALKARFDRLETELKLLEDGATQMGLMDTATGDLYLIDAIRCLRRKAFDAALALQVK